MSFKTKKENNSKESKERTKEKNYLITQIETIENSSLPFALIKLLIIFYLYQ